MHAHSHTFMHPLINICRSNHLTIHQICPSIHPLLLLLGWPQSTPPPPSPPPLLSQHHCSLSPAIPVIHRCQQAVSGEPGVCLQQINKCASLSSDATPATNAESKPPLSSCGWDPKVGRGIYKNKKCDLAEAHYKWGALCRITWDLDHPSNHLSDKVKLVWPSI